MHMSQSKPDLTAMQLAFIEGLKKAQQSRLERKAEPVKLSPVQAADARIKARETAADRNLPAWTKPEIWCRAATAEGMYYEGPVRGLPKGATVQEGSSRLVQVEVRPASSYRQAKGLSHLVRMYVAGDISDKELESGARWRGDWHASLTPTMSAFNPDRVSGGTEASPYDRHRRAAEAADECGRVADGLKKVSAEAYSIAAHVVLQDQSREAWAERHGLLVSEVTDRLRLALKTIGELYAFRHGQ